jgi:hypothetical protein
MRHPECPQERAGWRERRSATPITLIVAATMIAVRTKARAPHHQGPRSSVGTSSVRLFRAWYCSPVNVQKYIGETNPGLWLEDYQLACQASSVDSDTFIIHNVPLYLTDSARTWLEHLLPKRIKCWADLKEIFMGNFQGTYMCPRNP